MQRISDQELRKVNGGFSVWVAVGIGLAITFVAGVIDGIARPKKCHS